MLDLNQLIFLILKFKYLVLTIATVKFKQCESALRVSAQQSRNSFENAAHGRGT